MPINLQNDTLEIALKKLKARENTFELLESITKIGSWEVDLITHKSIWSKQIYINYGYEPFSVEPSMELFFSHVIPQDLKRTQEALNKIISTEIAQTHQCKVKTKFGKIIDIILNAQVIYDENHKPVKIIGTTQDITELMELKQQNSELSQLIEYSSNEIYIVNAKNNNYLYVNEGACKALGYSKSELLTMSTYDINPELTKKNIGLLHKKLILNKSIINRTQHRRKDGSTYTAQAYIHQITYKDKDAYVIFDTNISETIENELLLQKKSEQLQHQAHHDNLTGLPNRTLFKDRLSQTIISSNRHEKEFALLFIDLDKFKTINDSLGHNIGDKVLIEAALRLRKCVRDEDTIARLGGDEFTIILQGIKSIQDISNISEKIINEMREPIVIKAHTLYISASIGISLFPKDAKSSDELIKYADTAMYKAKEDGRDTYQYYASQMTAYAFEKVVMDTSLRVAIKEEQFIVYYQPQIDVKTEKIIGMEALVRWRHPTLGLVPPGKFIPLAEESGLIIDIDKQVRRDAMKQFALWYKEGLNPGKLSVNLAMKQLNEKDFLAQLSNIMQELGFNSDWLELEVTEGQVMNNPELSIEKLKTIHAKGIDLAIDDFGTGYSSLSYLKKLPLTKLKIDQSFIRDIPKDEDDIAITKAIIALGKSLKLKLIAEGVEDENQKQFLIDNDCDFIQGYLYSKPIQADAMTQLLRLSENGFRS